MNHNIFVAFALLINSTMPAMAVSYSLKDAFCTEYYGNSNNDYENQKSYEYCMQNVDNLIRTHESDMKEYQRKKERYRLKRELKKQEENSMMEKFFNNMPY